MSRTDWLLVSVLLALCRVLRWLGRWEAGAAPREHELRQRFERGERTLAAAAPDCGIPPPELRIAFIGDQGLGAEAVLHQGDLEYANDPAAWETQLDGVLGHDFPYFVSAGNHDEAEWDGAGGYGARVAARLDRLGIAYEGEPGVAAHVEWGGLSLVFVSPDVFQDGNTKSSPYITEHHGHSDCLWRISSWHKNQHLMRSEE